MVRGNISMLLRSVRTRQTCPPDTFLEGVVLRVLVSPVHPTSLCQRLPPRPQNRAASCPALKLLLVLRRGFCTLWPGPGAASLTCRIKMSVIGTDVTAVSTSWVHRSLACLLGYQICPRVGLMRYVQFGLKHKEFFSHRIAGCGLAEDSQP